MLIIGMHICACLIKNMVWVSPNLLNPMLHGPVIPAASCKRFLAVGDLLRFRTYLSPCHEVCSSKHWTTWTYTSNIAGVSLYCYMQVYHTWDVELNLTCTTMIVPHPNLSISISFLPFAHPVLHSSCPPLPCSICARLLCGCYALCCF